MNILDKPIEQPWAYAVRPGFKGDASGLYFRYHTTKEEAEKYAVKRKKKELYCGEVEYRPGESWYVGSI